MVENPTQSDTLSSGTALSSTSLTERLSNISQTDLIRYSINTLLFIGKIIIIATLVGVIVYGIYFIYKQYQINTVKSMVKTLDTVLDSEIHSKNNTNRTRIPVATNEPKEEVYNISSNVFTYPEAEPVCKAFNARLATLDDIQTAYDHGMNFCNYGWTYPQLAIYPIQQDYYDEIQKNSETKNTCGRPGINGGYFADNQLRFGVNCFGIKPQQKDIDRWYQEAMKKNVILQEEEMHQKSEQEIFEEKVEKYVTDNKESIIILPFNNTTWSEQHGQK